MSTRLLIISVIILGAISLGVIFYPTFETPKKPTTPGYGVVTSAKSSLELQQPEVEHFEQQAPSSPLSTTQDNSTALEHKSTSGTATSLLAPESQQPQEIPIDYEQIRQELAEAQKQKNLWVQERDELVEQFLNQGGYYDEEGSLNYNTEDWSETVISELEYLQQQIQERQQWIIMKQIQAEEHTAVLKEIE